MASPLQHDQATQQPGLSAPSTRNDRPAKLAARLRFATPVGQLADKADHALTLKPDQSVGAGHTMVIDALRGHCGEFGLVVAQGASKVE